ncbi:MAG TPA: tyrosine-protein phosphatase, partial [Chloroflexota bacterium]
QYGVETIIDLRTAEELQRYPNPFAQAGEHGIVYVNVSFVDPAAGPKADFTSLANDYKEMLELFQHRVVEVMKRIAGATPGAVLIHCMGGKDRTGLISALLLDLADVPRDVIGADYALTAECLREVDQEYLEHGPGDRAEREKTLVLYSPRSEVMLDVLAHLDERYGGTEAYLRDGGVTTEEIESLRRRLLPT